MRYRIEYADGKCCSFANSSRDLIDWLKLLKNETICDIRKIYKSGVTDSVKEKYQKYISNQVLQHLRDVTQDNQTKEYVLERIEKQQRGDEKT